MAKKTKQKQATPQDLGAAMFKAKTALESLTSEMAEGYNKAIRLAELKLSLKSALDLDFNDEQIKVVDQFMQANNEKTMDFLSSIVEEKNNNALIDEIKQSDPRGWQSQLMEDVFGSCECSDCTKKREEQNEKLPFSFQKVESKEGEVRYDITEVSIPSGELSIREATSAEVCLIREIEKLAESKEDNSEIVEHTFENPYTVGDERFGIGKEETLGAPAPIGKSAFVKVAATKEELEDAEAFPLESIDITMNYEPKLPTLSLSEGDENGDEEGSIEHKMSKLETIMQAFKIILAIAIVVLLTAIFIKI